MIEDENWSRMRRTCWEDTVGARPVSTYCHSEIGDPPEILLLNSRHVLVDIRTRGLVLPSLLPSDLCDGLSVSRGEQRRSAAGLRIWD